MYAVYLHAHQKIDRIAHKHMRQALEQKTFFPSIKNVLHFEGRRGPDATKLKNKEAVEQPWHFIDPFNVKDTELIGHIRQHYVALVSALKRTDETRSAFEAAWLAHALVDGLTPAHHFPYEQELEELRGESRDTRKGLVGRAFVKGETPSESFKRSFQLIGPKGLLTTHAMFEGGAYTIMAPLQLKRAMPSTYDLQTVRRIGPIEYFQRYAKEIAALNMYHRFYERGWTPKLVRDIRRELAPRMVHMVTVAWYSAIYDADLIPAEATIKP